MRVRAIRKGGAWGGARGQARGGRIRAGTGSRDLAPRPILVGRPRGATPRRTATAKWRKHARIRGGVQTAGRTFLAEQPVQANEETYAIVRAKFGAEGAGILAAAAEAAIATIRDALASGCTLFTTELHNQR